MSAPFNHFRFGPSNVYKLSRLFNRLQHSLHGIEQHTDHVVSERMVKYPDIKPKYPPGKWGEMDPKYAWLWNSAADAQKQIPDIEGRIKALIEKETSAIVLDPFNDHPSSLEFRQYVTKTQMNDWDKLSSWFENNNDSLEDDSQSGTSVLKTVASLLKQDVCDFLLMENEIIKRYGENDPNQLCHGLIGLLSTSLITHCGNLFPHLKTSQYDENVVVRSIWSRHGIERKRRKFTSDSDVYLFDTVNDQHIISEGHFHAMIRNHLPLPQCVPREEGISVSALPQPLRFKPSAYGHKKEQKKKIDNIIAGHKLGDPCEFGLVGLLSTCDSHSIEERMGTQTARDWRLAQGLTLTFSWLAAQAVNQGFSHLIDLTYPLTSQTVLTDGRIFSFLAYQLNTLELWKDDKANPMVNLCWHSKEMPLYHSVENGKVHEFNDEVLMTLVKMFTQAPMDRGYDMKPTVHQVPEVNSAKIDFIPTQVVVEEVIEEEQYIVS